MQYSVAMTAYFGRMAKSKYQPDCHLKATSQNHQIFDVRILGTLMHICTTYGVCMFKPMAGRGMHRQTTDKA